MSLDKSVLKKLALDNMNAAGAALDAGDFATAKEKASAAWTWYFELQKMRSDDEDFNDLIYWARDLYGKAEAGLQAQAAAEQEASEDAPAEEEYDPAQQYGEMRKNALGGFAGDAAKAVIAARWHLNPRNWAYLDAVGVDYVGDSAKLIEKVLGNDKAPAAYRAIAADMAAKMYRTPVFGNMNMDNASTYSRYAVQQALDDGEVDKDILEGIFQNALYIAMSRGEMEFGKQLYQMGRDQGLGEGLANELCRYAFRHKLPEAKELEDMMYKAKCWQGMCLHGLSLIDKLFESEDGSDNLYNFNFNELAPYCDTIPEPGRGDCIAVLVYSDFLNNASENYPSSDLFQFLHAEAQKFNPSAIYYEALIYDYVADFIKENNPDDERIAECNRKTLEGYKLAAGLGWRGAIEALIRVLRDGYGNPDELPRYLEYARLLDVKV